MRNMLNNKVVYQIYPKSFMDSNGDGIGDVQGIISKLDYLKNLGVDVIWLTPIFVSPQRDNGYDIENYYEIDPIFGTMEDVEELFLEAKSRDLDIMFDMVLNHTSTKHEWFQKALKGDKTYQDYYFFKEKPTNWESKFGGNAWEYVEDMKLYYLHLFDVTQADLNWENDAVFEEVCKIVNFWLDKGVKGLRFDVINLISKPEVFEDDFEGDGRRFYSDGKRVHEYLHKLNQETFGKHNDVITVGELSSTNIENGVRYADPKNQELSTIFNFHHLKVDYKNGDKWALKPFDFIELKQILSSWQYAMQENDALMALFLNNHDQPRSISRFGNDTQYWKQSGKMLAIAMQLMRGMPYIYQGEEIGLPNSYFESLETYRDIETINMIRILRERGLTESEVTAIIHERSRDNGRTPIPWNHSYQHGFTTGKPWLALSEYPELQTVEDNLSDSDSIYYTYHALIHLRKELPVIQSGNIEFLELDHPELLIYKRTLDQESVIVYCNFSNKEIDYTDIDQCGEILLTNYNVNSLSGKNTFKPYEALVLKI
ncbi:alpha,alpha-phosphotrehalase [Erysipelothrix inopinata]|uniref:Alpha,alpha-phosphotrehalase n=2 Tax=Erysipelothrix inopinata TaxID=225084 RepID=A0A7G9RYK9_9FIRM|nr:alpha,alpha-phosphotrehalase [Erysipelothrix inopinata]QNN60684.1 alpha,alpha-phosphotrehalase [Erysipelothrix inopinata]